MTFGIIGNTAKEVVRDVTRDVVAYLEQKGSKVLVHEALARWCDSSGSTRKIPDSMKCPESDLLQKSDIVISLGGDGTMLAAARIVGKKSIPLFGVNLGKLGFLAEVSIEEMHQAIDEVIEGKYTVEERMVLEAHCKQDGRSFFALNEIVVDKGASGRVIDLETYVNNAFLVTYTADGIIVNTPTGSTAYSLASGGPIVVPQSKVITINPIAPHTLTARPIIVPEGSVMRVVVKSPAKSVHITADGQMEEFYIPPIELTIRQADYKVKLVKRIGRTYYDLLRAKLMWGKDVRQGGK